MSDKIKSITILSLPSEETEYRKNGYELAGHVGRFLVMRKYTYNKQAS